MNYRREVIRALWRFAILLALIIGLWYWNPLHRHRTIKTGLDSTARKGFALLQRLGQRTHISRDSPSGLVGKL